MALSAIIVAIALSRSVESIENEFEELNDRTLQISNLLEKIRFSGLRIVSSTSEYLLIAATRHHKDTGEIQNTESSTPSKAKLIRTAAAELDSQLGRYRELVVAYFPDELGNTGRDRRFYSGACHLLLCLHHWRTYAQKSTGFGG